MVARWLRLNWVYAASGAVLGALIVGIQTGMSRGAGAAVSGAVLGGAVGAVVLLAAGALGPYERAQEVAAEALPPPALLRPLPTWDLLGQGRLIGWLFLNPEALKGYRLQVGEEQARQAAVWAASTLAWLPLLTAGLGAALRGSIALGGALGGAVFVLAALAVTVVAGLPGEAETGRRAIGGALLPAVLGYLFVVAVPAAAGVTAAAAQSRALGVLVLIALGVAGGLAVAIAGSVVEAGADRRGRLGGGLDLAALTHTTSILVICIGAGAGAGLALAFGDQLANSVGTLVWSALLSAAVPAVALGLVAGPAAQVLQRSSVGRGSIGRVVRWALLAILVLAQVVPLWATALRGWPLFS